MRQRPLALPSQPSAPLLHAARRTLLVAAVGLVACGGIDERPVEELVRTGETFLDPETMQPYSGIAYATFDDRPGAIAQRLSLRDGTYDGPFEAYFEDQTLSSREIYVDGRKHGPYAWYFENGQLFEEGTYRNGQLHGPYRAYWENGDLYEEGSYADGRFDGPRRWYMGGRLVELVTYDRGVMQGLYERYLQDGTLDLKGILHAGEPCGTWIERDRTLPYARCPTRVVD